MNSHYTDWMGERLQREVERQLLEDLTYYGICRSDLRVDWTDPCGEGHCTHVFGGILEGVSDISVIDEEGNAIAEGWMDFLHGGGDSPLYVFWLFLHIRENDLWKQVKSQPTIPEQVWNRLPEEVRTSRASKDIHDARWSKVRRAEFEQALAKVPDVPPNPHDAL